MTPKEIRTAVMVVIRHLWAGARRAKQVADGRWEALERPLPAELRAHAARAASRRTVVTSHHRKDG